MDTSQDPTFDRALAAFSEAFASGDAETLVDLFTEDARVIQHEESVLIGRTAIGEMLTELFAMVDTAAFEVDYEIVDVHDHRAYVLATFHETLRPKDGVAPAIDVDGRLVCCWQRRRWHMEGGPPARRSCLTPSHVPVTSVA